MIEKMRKITLITERGGMTKALRAIADLELVHIPLQTTLRSSNDTVEVQLSELEQLKALLPKVKPNTDLPLSEIERRVAYAQEVMAQILEHERESLAQKNTADQLEPWNNFDHSLLNELLDHNLTVKFYVVLKKQLAAFKNTRCWVIKKEKQTYICTITHGEETLPDEFRPVQLPQTNLHTARSESKRHAAEALKLRRAIGKDSYSASCVLAYIEHLEQVFYSLQAYESRNKDEALEWVTGFVPLTAIANLEKSCKKHMIGLYFQDVSETDPVPTKLKRNIIANTIQPIFDLFGTIPGYKEFDIRSVFLLFFTLFFAMIVSDAGYSLIFCGVALFTLIHALVSRKNLYGNVLFLILSLAALVWGAASGSWFGNPTFLEIPLLRNFVLPYLWVDSPQNHIQISLLCMTIGMAHIFVAHLWRALRAVIRGPRLQFFGECGWMALLLGLYYLVLSVVIDAALFPIPAFTWPLVFVGIGGILLFGAQEGRFFFGILKGVSSIHTIVLDAIGMFSDIISYIRLYAVGLAGLAVARSFTEMASSIGGSTENLVLSILSILVLVFGHTLNIAMTALSVVVHGVRLNMLEFSRHLGMEWNGIVYKPLKSSPVKG